MKLLLLLGETSEIRLTDARQHLQVASSTAHRLLVMLQWRGFVGQDANTKVYRPGPALTNIAFSILERMDVPRIAQPILDDLSQRLHETAHLGTIDGNETRFLAASEPSTAVRVATRLGRHIPAHCTSTGKVLLYNLTQEQLFRLYPKEQLAQVTSHSIDNRSDLQRALEKIRNQGFAINIEESEEGVASVAVAVPNSAGGRYAFNLSAPVHRLPAEKYKPVAEELHSAARQLANLLG